jgi:hypothetical protein
MPEPLVIRMPIDVRSLALSIIAGIALLLVLRSAQSVSSRSCWDFLGLCPARWSARSSVSAAPLARPIAVSLLVGSIGLGVIR